MKTRSLLAVLLSCALALFAAGCGDDNDDAAARKAAAEAAAEDASADDGGSSSGSDSGSDSNSGSDADSEVSMPNLDDLDLEGLGEQFGDCMSVGMAYAGLAMSALGGEEAAKAAQQSAASMKSSLPKDLHDDLEVIADAYAELAEKGIMKGSDALDTPEFEKANENITAYLDEACDVEQ